MGKEPAKKIEHRNIPFSELVFMEDNPRRISESDFDALVESIRKDPAFFDNRPCLINHTDGKYLVYAGFQRAHAAHLRLGWQEIPCSIEADVPEAVMRERAIRDNTHQGTWDSDVLSSWDFEVPELREFGVPEFVFGEVDNSLNSEKQEAQEDNYEIPDDIKTDIVTGDLFEIGPHRLLCGDSTSADDVARLMGGEKADIEILDPLFDMNYSQIATTLPGVICIFSRGAKSFRFLADMCDAGYGYHNLVNLTPANGVAEETLPANTHEIIHILRREKKFDHAHAINFCKTDGVLRATSVMNFGRPTTGDGYFKYAKPIGEISYLFAYGSLGGLVLDLFLGSGTTMVAAHQLNRRCYGMEIDGKYCQVIVDRMLKLDPTLEIKRNGQPYIKKGDL